MRRNDVRVSKKLHKLDLPKYSSSPKSPHSFFPALRKSVLRDASPLTSVPMSSLTQRSYTRTPGKLNLNPVITTNLKIKIPQKPQVHPIEILQPVPKQDPNSQQELSQKYLIDIKSSRSSFKIGNVLKEIDFKLSSFTPESKIKDFTINQNFSSLFPVKSAETKSLNKLELMRKVLAAVFHFKHLNLDTIPFNRRKELFPGVPYGLKDSKKFMKAVKEGETSLVLAMLQENKWLAHVYDYTGQTPLHWAVIRGYLDIVKILIQYKAFVDVTDFIGRTPAFNAAKFGCLKIFAFLVENEANLIIKTRAKTAIWHVAGDLRILKILNEFKKKMVFWRYGLRVPAYSFEYLV